PSGLDSFLLQPLETLDQYRRVIHRRQVTDSDLRSIAQNALFLPVVGLQRIDTMYGNDYHAEDGSLSFRRLIHGFLDYVEDFARIEDFTYSFNHVSIVTLRETN